MGYLIEYDGIPVISAEKGLSEERLLERCKDFPYWYKVLPPAKSMFKNLKRDKLFTHNNIKGYESVLDRKYPRDYMRSDGISNHFTEKVRMECKFGDLPSPMEVWCEDYYEILQSAELFINVRRGIALREALYKHIRECNIFNPAFGLFLLRTLAKKMKKRYNELRIMDPSSGWGDRCIAACALGASEYHGYDPNIKLQGGYNKIISSFLPKHAISGDYWISTSPFEKAQVNKNYYDVVLTSPPFFDLEKYPDEGGEIALRLPTYEDWVELFYIPYLVNAWNGLRVGGYLVLYISDIVNAPLAADTKDIIEMFPGNAVGPMVYGFRQSFRNNSRIRPAYIWQKKN